MSEVTKEDFLLLLEKVMNHIENTDLSHIDNGEDFEDFVFSLIKQFSNHHVEQTGKQSFPDIIIGSYGVEVKFTKSNKWESMGNSIFEGTYRNEVSDDIYVFFGKKVSKSKVQIRYDLYENCLADVKVTHSPRFYINMDLSEGESILNEVGVSYKTYRKLQSNERGREIKKYLKSKLNPGEIVWWMEEGERSVIIKKFKTLKLSEQLSLRAELFALFPEVVSNSNSKFEKAQLHLLNLHQVTFSRDLFTAGGQVSLLINNQYILRIPAIFGKLYDDAKNIKKFIEETPNDILYEQWMDLNVISLNEVNENKDKAWQKILNNISITLPEGILPSDVYLSGIKKPAI